jgi:hypothetical protein
MAGDESITARQITKTSFLLASSPRMLLCFGVIFLAGLLPRLHDFSRSLWNDDSWVANSVLADTLYRMFYYDRWLQTSPPLFLMLVRYTVKVSGLSNYTLRAVPLMFSIVALLLFAEVSCRILEPAYALLSTAILAISPAAIVESSELKQFSSDLAAAVIVLLTLCNYWQHSDKRQWYWLLGSFAAALALSYTTVIFIPLALIVLYKSTPHITAGLQPRNIRRSRITVFLVTVSAISGVNYLFFIRPNSPPNLKLYWQLHFPQSSILQGMLFYGREVTSLVVFSVLPRRWLPQGDSPSRWLLGVLSIMAIAIFCLVFAAILRRPKYVDVAALCVVPIFTLLILNLMHMYPLHSLMLTLCVLPCVAIGLALAIEALCQEFVIPFVPVRFRMAIWSTLCVLGLVFIFLPSMMPLRWLEYQEEDAEGAIHYLKSHVAPGDLVYVHASASETSRLYLRMLQWQPALLIYGHTGYPCCTRKSQDYALPDELQYREDFDNAIRDSHPKRLWLVFTGRKDHWEYLHRDESQILTGRLPGLGCSSVFTLRLVNEVVYEFDCCERPPLGSPAATSNRERGIRRNWRQDTDFREHVGRMEISQLPIEKLLSRIAFKLHA